jgi:thioredoxin-related protein
MLNNHIKSIFIFFLIVSIFPVVFAQSIKTVSCNGIQFENGQDWEQVKQKAKSENKYIFVDCFTTWCSPCKQMERYIFSQKDVGDFFNSEFINVKIQFDSSNHDNEEVSRWRSITRIFEQEFKISRYPTYLFFSPQGILVTKEEGATKTTEGFITKAKAALDPSQQYYTLKERFKSGDVSANLIKYLVPKAVSLEDKEIAYAAHDQYFELIDKKYTKGNLTAICGSISSIHSRGFQLLVEEPDRVNEILEEEDRAQRIVKDVLSNEIDEKFIKGRGGDVDWKSVLVELKRDAPAMANEILMLLKYRVAAGNNKWNEYGKNLVDYYDKYYYTMKGHGKHFFMNNELWTVFERTTDKKALKRAAEWCKKTIVSDEGNEVSGAIDTYANLLHKVGKTKEAIVWEEKALKMVKQEQNTEWIVLFSERINKMRNGKPTWSVPASGGN